MDKNYFRLNHCVLSGIMVRHGDFWFLESKCPGNGTRFSVKVNVGHIPGLKLKRGRFCILRGGLRSRPMKRKVRNTDELKLFISYSKQYAQQFLTGELNKREYITRLNQIRERYLNRYSPVPDSLEFFPVEVICYDPSWPDFNSVTLAGYISDYYSSRNAEFSEVSLKVYREPDYNKETGQQSDMFIVTIPLEQHESFQESCNPGAKISLTGSLFSKIELREVVIPRQFSGFLSEFGKLIKEANPEYSRNILTLGPFFDKKVISRTKILVKEFNVIKIRKEEKSLF